MKMKDDLARSYRSSRSYAPYPARSPWCFACGSTDVPHEALGLCKGCLAADLGLQRETLVRALRSELRAGRTKPAADNHHGRRNRGYQRHPLKRGDVATHEVFGKLVILSARRVQGEPQARAVSLKRGAIVTVPLRALEAA
jgi:hypothetical protein